MESEQIFSILFFSIVGGIVVSVGVKHFQEKKRIQIRTKGEKRENLKDLAKLYFMRMKSLMWQKGELSEADENSPSLKANENEPILDIAIPKLKITLFSEEILEKIKTMDIPEDIVDELLTVLADIPSIERLDFLNRIFCE